MKPAPQRASDAMTEKRGAEDQQHKIECDSSGKVELWLERRVERPKKIDDAEAGSVLKEQHNRMGHCKRNRTVGCPSMEGKDVQSAVWPLSDRAIAQSDQQPEQEREGCGTHSAEPKIGTKIKYGHRPLLAGECSVFFAVQCMVIVID